MSEDITKCHCKSNSICAHCIMSCSACIEIVKSTLGHESKTIGCLRHNQEHVRESVEEWATQLTTEPRTK